MHTTFTARRQRVEQLRQQLNSAAISPMPCCFDALSARLIEQAGYPLTFMSGFATAASRAGLPDTGLLSYGEVLDQGRNIIEAVSIPVIGDADTGYGNSVSAQRTVWGYIRAGFAGLMVEDQLAPKRCGHTRGKEVVSRSEALSRLQAVLDARDLAREQGEDLVVIARTDARATQGLDEALERARLFHEMGADLLFVEAPCSEYEMAQVGELPGHKMANLVEHGDTPMLSLVELERLGFSVVAYPLTLLSVAAKAMQQALQQMQAGGHPAEMLQFDELQSLVGFPQYDEQLQRYQAEEDA